MATAVPSRSVLIALYDDRTAAERAVDELEQAGFSSEDAGMAIRGSDAVRGGMIVDAQGTKDGSGLAAGAATGGLVGGILGALASLAIPGVGPVIAGGVLATALGFGAAGAMTGGLLGAMAGLGVSEDEAKQYEREFNSGRAIVMVRPRGREEIAAAILRRHGGYDLQREQRPAIGAADPVSADRHDHTQL